MQHLRDDAGVKSSLDELQLGAQHLLILQALQIPTARLLLGVALGVQGSLGPARSAWPHLALALPKQWPLVYKPRQAGVAAAGCQAASMAAHLQFSQRSMSFSKPWYLHECVNQNAPHGA